MLTWTSSKGRTWITAPPAGLGPVNSGTTEQPAPLSTAIKQHLTLKTAYENAWHSPILFVWTLMHLIVVTGCQGMRTADEEAYYQTVFTENTESVQHITYVNHRQWRDSNKKHKYTHGKLWN